MNGAAGLERRSSARSGWLALGLAAASLAVFATLALLAPAERGPRGDEPTYRAMVGSLLLDGDLRFTEADAARQRARAETVILQRSADGTVAYSKPALHPLASAPFVAAAGEAGYPLANAVLLAAALLPAWALLRRTGAAGEAALTLLTFLAPSVVLFYLSWRTADLLQFSLALGGLALALASERGSAARPPGARWLDGTGAALAGGFCLGLLASLRFPNALLAAAAVGALAVRGRRRRAVAVLLAALLGLGGSLAANRVFTGAANPYKAVRASFNPQIGFPAGAQAGAAARQFDEQRKTVRMGVRPALEPALTLYSGLYFFVGRHTGLLFYFPAAIWLAAAAVRRPDRVTWALVGAAVGLALFYLVWLPRNYFGGGTFVGNRYFLVAYPALLVALRRPLSRRLLAAAWAVAAAVAVSATVSVSRAAPLESSSQLHAYAGLFRWLPLESTAEALDGPRERYWSDERLLFADPYARVGPHGFHLRSDLPPAELLLASGRAHGVVRLLVQADVPRAVLRFSDWRSERTVELAEVAGEGIARGVVEIEAAPAWRRHPFPWSEGESWPAWAFRLAVAAEDGGPVEAELRYLGPYRLVRKFYSHQTMALELPAVAAAGGRSRIAVQALNRGRRPWASRADVPVHLRYRLEPEGGGEEIVGPVSRLPGEVAHREVLNGVLRVRWPERPGRYVMTVDLVLAGTVWFETIGGHPLARGGVEVVAPREDGAVEAAAPVVP